MLFSTIWLADDYDKIDRFNRSVDNQSHTLYTHALQIYIIISIHLYAM